VLNIYEQNVVKATPKTKKYSKTCLEILFSIKLKIGVITYKRTIIYKKYKCEETLKYKTRDTAIVLYKMIEYSAAHINIFIKIHGMYFRYKSFIGISFL